MLEVKTGDILKSQAPVLVNPVNCEGVMGAGLAREFRHAFPDMHRYYRAQCARKAVRIGELTTFSERDKLIINFPTKNEWHKPSHFDYIAKGLDALGSLIRGKDIKWIAVPALGCGLGRLEWPDVLPLIRAKIGCLPGVKVEVYEPRNQPTPHERGTSTRRRPAR